MGLDRDACTEYLASTGSSNAEYDDIRLTPNYLHHHVQSSEYSRFDIQGALLMSAVYKAWQQRRSRSRIVIIYTDKVEKLAAVAGEKDLSICKWWSWNKAENYLSPLSISARVVFAEMHNLSISCAMVCVILLASAALLGTFGIMQRQISAVLITGVMYILAGIIHTDISI